MMSTDPSTSFIARLALLEASLLATIVLADAQAWLGARSDALVVTRAVTAANMPAVQDAFTGMNCVSRAHERTRRRRR